MAFGNAPALVRNVPVPVKIADILTHAAGTPHADTFVSNMRIDPDMPTVTGTTITADTRYAAFGDFKEGYLIVDRPGMRVTRDEIVKHLETNQVRLTEARYGGETEAQARDRFLRSANSRLGPRRFLPATQ